MTPEEFLAAAENLLSEARPETRGIWARAAAMLVRQALECLVGDRLDQRAMGARSANFRVQFLCLAWVGGNPDLAGRLSCTWAALSRANHHHGYELPPTETELRGWMTVAREALEVSTRRP